MPPSSAAQTAAQTLATFATGLTEADIPADVARLARICLIDAVACAAFGARFAWSQMIMAQAAAGAGPGRAHLPGVDLPGLPARAAALVGGSLAHAFELDSLRKPGAGVHAGATVALPALAVAQETGADEAALLRAIVAATEVMFRIGDATLHSAEGRGFHAPGMTGPFGAAVAAALLYGLSPAQTAHALGIAGSMGGGVLAFAHGSGGMVKRLHMGRAAEGGVLAAQLAARGYEGPAEVLEGRHGVLEAFCPAADPARLTAGLGTEWELRKLCLKRYACHVTAQAPVELLREEMARHGFDGADIAGITLGVSAKVLSHHANTAPTDVAGAQYSMPFALASAAFDPPDDPMSFARGLERPEVRALARAVDLLPGDLGDQKWGVEMDVRLHSGQRISSWRMHFRGTPENPFTDADLAHKVQALTGQAVPDAALPPGWLNPAQATR